MTRSTRPGKRKRSVGVNIEVVHCPAWKVGRGVLPDGRPILAVQIPYPRLIGIPAVAITVDEALEIIRLLSDQARLALLGVPEGGGVSAGGLFLPSGEANINGTDKKGAEGVE
jgi:hypothetical protein